MFPALLPVLLALPMPPAEPPLSDLQRFPSAWATTAALEVLEAEQERLQLRIANHIGDPPELEERLTDLRVRWGAWKALDCAWWWDGQGGSEDMVRWWLSKLRERLNDLDRSAYFFGRMPYPVDPRYVVYDP